MAIGPGGTPRARHGVDRALAVFAVVVLLEIIVVVGIAGWVLLGVRQELEDGGREARVGRAALLDTDLAAAEEAFGRAAANFEGAQDGLANPAVRVLGLAPVIGSNVRTTTALAVAGGEVADASAQLLGTVNDLPGGLEALLPSDGRFPIDRLATVAAEAGAAAERLADADATVAAAPQRGLVEPVAAARTQFVDELAVARDLVDGAASATGALAAFLGVDGPRRYLFGAQNPSELRGTGGYIGAYAVATFDRGRLELSRFTPVQQLQSLPLSEVPPPNADYAARYNRYGGAGFWPAINATPDFPSAAQAMLSLYSRTEGADLDGVVVVDPEALRALVRLVGGVEVPGFGRVGADEVVAVVSNRAYGEFDSPDQRKEILGSVAGAALRRLLSSGADIAPTDLLDVLAPIAQDRHMLLYSADPPVQQALTDSGLAGALPPPDGDTVAVVVNNTAVNKVDFYVDRRVDHRVRLRPDGSADARLRVTFRNRAPASGRAKRVLGPNTEGLDAGDTRGLVSIFCGRCEPTAATPPIVSGSPASGMVIEQELGHTVGTTHLTVPRETRRSVTLSWRLPDAWDVDGDGCYAFTYTAQPTSTEAHLRVSVQAPDGYVARGGSGDGSMLHDGAVAGGVSAQACYAASDGVRS